MHELLVLAAAALLDTHIDTKPPRHPARAVFLWRAPRSS
jgi:hypothetical protein